MDDWLDDGPAFDDNAWQFDSAGATRQPDMDAQLACTCGNGGRWAKQSFGEVIEVGSQLKFPAWLTAREYADRKCKTCRMWAWVLREDVPYEPAARGGGGRLIGKRLKADAVLMPVRRKLFTEEG